MGKTTIKVSKKNGGKEMDGTLLESMNDSEVIVSETEGVAIEEVTVSDVKEEIESSDKNNKAKAETLSDIMKENEASNEDEDG